MPELITTGLREAVAHTLGPEYDEMPVRFLFEAVDAAVVVLERWRESGSRVGGEPPPPIPCPEGFHWIGQSFAHCDKCGLSAWDHEGMAVLPPHDSSPFSNSAFVLKPWGPGAVEKIRHKWEVRDA